MTTFLLARHGSHDWLARGVPGRLAGVGLNDDGQRQARELVDRLRPRRVQLVYSSPQQRARETAAPAAAALGLPVHIDDSFDEIDFGEWTGRSFDELRQQGQRWQDWCERKSIAGAPGGEAFVEVQRRAMAGVEHLRRVHPSETVLLVSHGDVIKAVLAGFLGLPLDHVERFDIDPASLSVIDTGEDWFKVRQVNGA
jgi:broad specificity phosphatase PhoE